ncbi:MAG: hypothetical protein DRJ43_02310 [Thermoprotei archaeon]|nr:MAG: hypothetical protein DRJ43_02310 [Thermoprotei archaeon]
MAICATCSSSIGVLGLVRFGFSMYYALKVIIGVLFALLIIDLALQKVDEVGRVRNHLILMGVHCNLPYQPEG